MIVDHPYNDPKLKTIVGTRPEGYVWCDECLRWEHGHQHNNPRPEMGRMARFFEVLADFFYACYMWCALRSDYAQARYLVSIGEGLGPAPELDVEYEAPPTDATAMRVVEEFVPGVCRNCRRQDEVSADKELCAYCESTAAFDVRV
jgi:hypothetical protein